MYSSEGVSIEEDEGSVDVELYRAEDESYGPPVVDVEC